MLNRTIIINPVEPALLSIRCPLGVDLDLGLTFLKQDRSAVDPDTIMPQLALMSRSRTGIYAVDMETSDSGSGRANVTVPGGWLTDVAGYNLELYQRRASAEPSNPPVPTGMLAKGVIRLEGDAYFAMGPLMPITVPVIVGPAGPAGPQGDPGQRGSMWFTGDGAPVDNGSYISGDMWLDNLTGDVWRYNGAVWVLGSF